MLSPLQLKGVQAILESRTYRQAAKSLGINECTIYEWLKNPEFRSAVNDALGDCVQATVLTLAQASVEAANALRKQLASKNPSPSKISAAATILKHFARYHELYSLTADVRSLEERIADHTNRIP